MGKSRLGLTATGFASVAILLIFIAFVTSSWLVTDGGLENPKFEKLGLWFVCFNHFEDVRHWYDTKFTGCWWIYQEEYYIIHELILPGFFIATEFFFTICFILTLASGLLLLGYLMSSRDNDDFICLLTLLGAGMLVSALFGTVALIIFGMYGDSRYWMPDWEHNNMGWSYVLAVIGTVSSYIGGILFLVESRVHRLKNTRFRRGPIDYDTRDPKSYGHSDI